jgi:hypothetical protein
MNTDLLWIFLFEVLIRENSRESVAAFPETQSQKVLSEAHGVR